MKDTFQDSPFRALIALLLFSIIPIQTASQWTLEYYDTTYYFRDLNFLNENTGFAFGENIYYQNNNYWGIIVKTTNAGNNWNIVFLDTNVFFYGSGFLNSTTGFAVGGLYSLQPKIVKTTDGGNSWHYINPIGINSLIRSITIFGSTAYATCVSGLFKSDNTGISWTPVNTFFSPYACSYFLNENSGWYFTEYGNVFKTTNAGTNWVQSNLNYRYPHSSQFINANTGFLICDSSDYFSSKILKTTNGGLSWSELSTGLNNQHWSIHFVNENTGYVCGNLGGVIKTTNSGATWTISWTGLNFNLFDITFTDAYTGYSCGMNSIIIKTTCGGFLAVSPVSNEIPEEFSLYQNYPNPFNPSILIKFAVAEAANVRIAIFDALGRELETLVNENLNPGIYEISWDGSKYSSGIYFYKLLTKDYSSVKKMSLIK